MMVFLKAVCCEVPGRHQDLLGGGLSQTGDGLHLLHCSSESPPS